MAEGSIHRKALLCQSAVAETYETELPASERTDAPFAVVATTADPLAETATEGDRFVICSYGEHDVVETDALAGLVSRGALEKAADALEREVVSRGAPDNYSFVIVEIGGAQ